MQRVMVKWKGICPRHPRFNGEWGRGAVKGGCHVCDALVTVAQVQTQLRAACERAESAIAGERSLQLAAAERRAARRVAV